MALTDSSGENGLFEVWLTTHDESCCFCNVGTASIRDDLQGQGISTYLYAFVHENKQWDVIFVEMGLQFQKVFSDQAIFSIDDHDANVSART